MSIESILKNLRQPIPRERIKQRDGNKQGTFQVDYIEWATAADLLDEHCPGWQFEVIQLDSFGEDTVLCRGKLTIEGVSRENVGAATMANFQTLENTLKDAVSDCLKRCAVLFGVARDLYQKDSKPASMPPRQQQRPTPAPKPVETRHQPVELPATVAALKADLKKLGAQHAGAEKAMVMKLLSLKSGKLVEELTSHEADQLHDKILSAIAREA